MVLRVLMLKVYFLIRACEYFSSVFITPSLCTILSFLHLNESGQGESTVQMKATLGLSPVAAFSSLILHFPVT